MDKYGKRIILDNEKNFVEHPKNIFHLPILKNKFDKRLLPFYLGALFKRRRRAKEYSKNNPKT